MSKEPLVGQLLGHYRLLEQIGAGGMGVVYRAHDEHLNRDVAAKVLPAGSLANEETRKRFKQEAHALARLNHPNIATIFDFDCEGTTDFLVMELLTRQTLADKLLAGPLPPNVVIEYGIQMAEGLAAAHQQGILHRDLKPGNLGLTAEGRVKLLDFGLAKLLTTDPADVTQSMTGVGLAKGTLAYMAPEQLRGENIDTRVDIYAAGSVLYEMATGKRPHPQVGPLLINAILNRPPVPPSVLNQAVNPALEAITLKALQKDPKLRYQSAKELAADLERLNAATVPVALRQASRQRFRQSLRPVMLVAGVLLLAIVSWQISRRIQDRPTEGPRPTLLVGDFENKTGEPVFDSTLREMFTSSLDQSHLVQAVLMFSKAVELDPNFAVAHEYLGHSYRRLNEYERFDEQIREAAKLASRVSEPERLRIMAAYNASLLDFQKQCENYQLLSQLQPMDPAPYINLGVCKRDQLEYAAAVPFTEKALQFVPQSGVRINLASQLLAAGDTERALKEAQPFSREFPNDLFAQTSLGGIYLALGRFEDARQTFKGMAQTGPGAEIEADLFLADLDLTMGQYGEAEKELKAAIQAAMRDHDRVSATRARIALAELLLQKGSSSQASQQLAQVDLPAHTPSLDLLLARTYAWTGNLQPANKSLHNIDALINEHDVPALQALRSLTSAEIALVQRRVTDAVQSSRTIPSCANPCERVYGRHSHRAF